MAKYVKTARGKVSTAGKTRNRFNAFTNRAGRALIPKER